MSTQIEILPADRVPSDANGIVFRHHAGRAIVAAVAALAAGAVLLWAGLRRGSALTAYLGGLAVVSVLVFHRLALARARASNWLRRLGERGVFIQFRSYVNQHLPPADPTVVFVPYGAIRLVRRRTERKETAYRDSDDAWTTRTSVETITWVVFEVSESTQALTQALDAELAKRPTTGALYKDYPVRVPEEGVMQLRWTVRPSVDVLLAALRPHVPIGDPARADTDFTDLRSVSALEQRRRIEELVRTGDTVTAVRVARAVYGTDLADARSFVEQLSTQEAAPDRGGSLPRIASGQAPAPARPRQGAAARSTWRAVVWHALVAVAATYPMAAICVSVFRFPVPLGGYVSGVDAVPLSALAVTVYGVVFGGFGVQAVMGALAGRLAARLSQRYGTAPEPAGVVLAVAASAPGIAALAILDWLIGPW